LSVSLPDMVYSQQRLHGHRRLEEK
jgi:hypothetical protein